MVYVTLRDPDVTTRFICTESTMIFHIFKYFRFMNWDYQ